MQISSYPLFLIPLVCSNREQNYVADALANRALDRRTSNDWAGLKEAKVSACFPCSPHEQSSWAIGPSERSNPKLLPDIELNCCHTANNVLPKLAEWESLLQRGSTAHMASFNAQIQYLPMWHLNYPSCLPSEVCLQDQVSFSCPTAIDHSIQPASSSHPIAIKNGFSKSASKPLGVQNVRSCPLHISHRFIQS